MSRALWPKNRAKSTGEKLQARSIFKTNRWRRHVLKETPMVLPSSSTARPIPSPSFPVDHQVARRFGQILTELCPCFCFCKFFGYKVAHYSTAFQTKSFWVKRSNRSNHATRLADINGDTHVKIFCLFDKVLVRSPPARSPPARSPPAPSPWPPTSSPTAWASSRAPRRRPARPTLPRF